MNQNLGTIIIGSENMKKRNIWLSFLIPFFIYLTIFSIYSLLSDKMIIFGDSSAQYYPLFNYLKGIMEGTNSIFYSLSKGLGGTMFGTFFYYLSSPFNLILYLIDKANILNFITILVIVKLSLCSMTMYIYMSKKFNNHSLTILLFSLLYSFTGYNLHYCLNIMWLGVVLLTPLVLLGIDKIINQKKPTTYIFFLTLSIISNYYIAYMLCIFSVLYFFYELLRKYDYKKDKVLIKNLTLRFFISSLLCGLMCAFFLIPCIVEMLDYGRGVGLADIFTFDYNIFNILAATYIGGADLFHPFGSTAIDLYCGIIVLPLVFLYFKNQAFPRKEKIVTFIILMLGILPCFIGLFNYIWHVFSIPFGYYYRYSFLICLFMIMIGYRSFQKLHITKTDLLSYLAVYIAYSAIILFISYFKNYYPFLDYKWVWLTNLLLIIYLLLLFKLKDKKKLINILTILVLFEVSCNVAICFYNEKYYPRTELLDYTEIINQYQPTGRMIVRFDSVESPYNRALLYNYNSTDSFLSTINDRANHLVQTLGSNHSLKVNNYLVQNPIAYIAHSLLGVETIITKEDLNYPIIDHIDDLYVYQNDNALSLGYIIKQSCNQLDLSFPYDEKMLNCLTGEEHIYYKEYQPITSNQYSISSKYYIIYLQNIQENIQSFVNLLGDSILYTTNDFILVQNKQEQFNLDLSTIESSIDNLKVYYFDYELFQDKINLLKAEQLQYTTDGSILTGSITTKGGLLMITIPYERGIKVLVDNQTVSYETALDALIAIPLEEGTHTVEIKYQQPGLIIGTSISIISLLITGIYIKTTKKWLT